VKIRAGGGGGGGGAGKARGLRGRSRPQGGALAEWGGEFGFSKSQQ
jgi:hypothetical protein